MLSKGKRRAEHISHSLLKTNAQECVLICPSSKGFHPGSLLRIRMDFERFVWVVVLRLLGLNVLGFEGFRVLGFVSRA